MTVNKKNEKVCNVNKINMWQNIIQNKIYIVYIVWVIKYIVTKIIGVNGPEIHINYNVCQLTKGDKYVSIHILSSVIII